MMAFENFKIWLVATTGLDKDALHVYAGLTVMFATAMALRTTLRSILPWLAVLIGAVVLELPDMKRDLDTAGHWDWTGSVHDIVNTLFWPTVLLFLSRSRTLFAF